VNTAGIDEPARRAALALHAMAGPDRDWLLREMPASDRAKLQSLVCELSELGIPQELSWVEEAVGPATIEHACARPVRASAQLSRREAATLAQWLADEPAQLAASLFRVRPEWRQRLLGAVPRLQRQQLASLAAALRPAPALDRFLLAAAINQLQAPRTGTHAWRRWLLSLRPHHREPANG
jgi:hypothetical protein